MCTGDNIDTATAISKDAGIIDTTKKMGKYTCMIGQDFRQLVGDITEVEDPSDKTRMTHACSNMKNFKMIFKDLRVLGRSSPKDKMLLVTGIQYLKNVVAVTGDGTNDAPAL